MKAIAIVILAQCLMKYQCGAQAPVLEDIVQHLRIENKTVEFTFANGSNSVNYSLEVVDSEGNIVDSLGGFGSYTDNSMPFSDKTVKLQILFSENSISIGQLDKKRNQYAVVSSGRGWGGVVSGYNSETASYNSKEVHVLQGENCRLTLKEFELGGELFTS